jgi:hypothetical protein
MFRYGIPAYTGPFRALIVTNVSEQSYRTPTATYKITRLHNPEDNNRHFHLRKKHEFHTHVYSLDFEILILFVPRLTSCKYSERCGRVVNTPAYWEVPGLYLGPETGYPDCGFS